jgi:hypothetical protein
MGSIPNGSAPLQARARQIFMIMTPGRTGKAQVSGASSIFPNAESQTLATVLGFLGFSSCFLLIFDVGVIFFYYERLSMQKCMPGCSGGAYGLCPAFRSTFHFPRMKRPFHSAVVEIFQRFRPSKRKFITVSLFKMFHSFIDFGLSTKWLG